jgi:hypothetical protein
MLVRRIVVNIEGAITNQSSVGVRDRTEAVSRILNEQREFPASGFDDKGGYYWARTAEKRAATHRWTIDE